MARAICLIFGHRRYAFNLEWQDGARDAEVKCSRCWKVLEVVK